MIWQTVIGLEVHAQLKTKSKLFSCSSTTFGAPANTQTSFIDAGFPGVLPVLNQQAVKMAIQFGLSIQAEINNFSFFERKNYFYPDLPKGYQISQFQRPIVGEGYLDVMVENQVKRVEILRAHLEEDAGKSLHDATPVYTGIDLNRAGTPLLEIVTTPCLFSANEAVSYLKALQQLLRFLDICDGNMEEGSFRCDVNLSLKPCDQDKLGTRVELKNLNSFRFIEKAIRYEQLRQQDILESGQQLHQETRLYCAETDTTQSMRSKENENDYRYFPDPDLLPIEITAEDIELAKITLPNLPSALMSSLLKEDGLSQDDADFLLTSPPLIRYYQEVKQLTHAPAKLLTNWLKGPYTSMLNEYKINIEQPPITAKDFAQLLDHLAEKSISNAVAKTIFSQLHLTTSTVDELITASGYQPVNDHQMIEEMIHVIIKNHPQQAADYRAGKDKLLGFFVGQVMKQTKGQADPTLINDLVRKHLSLPLE